MGDSKVFTVESFEHAPERLAAQVPLGIELLRQISGSDRDDYWLGKFTQNAKDMYVALAARAVGEKLDLGFSGQVGFSYVTDISLLQDEKLDLKKCTYVAIATGTIEFKEVSVSSAPAARCV